MDTRKRYLEKNLPLYRVKPPSDPEALKRVIQRSEVGSNLAVRTMSGVAWISAPTSRVSAARC